MHFAIISPEGVPPSEANVAQSIEVYTGSDDQTLQRASDSGRLRCPGCLGRLIVERSPAVYGSVSHFRHHPSTNPDCPFRVNWDWPPDESLPPVSRRGEDPGMIVERLLLRALQRNLSDRPGIEIRPIKDRLPRIEIDGLGVPIEILSLAPGDQARWSQPFEGGRDGRQTLFFVAGWDLHQLDGRTFRETLLPTRPWIVVWPARSGDARNRFAIVSWLPEPSRERFPIVELDVAWLDVRQLLGEHLSDGDALFLRKPYRLALERLARAIQTEPSDTPLQALWRLVAKVLLVEGAGVHRSLFKEERSSALEPYLPSPVFPAETEVFSPEDLTDLLRQLAESEIAQQDALIRETAGRLVGGYLPFLRKQVGSLAVALKASRHRESELSEKLDQETAKAANLKSQLERANSRAIALEAELEAEQAKTAAIENRVSEIATLRSEIERLQAALAEKTKLEQTVQTLTTKNDDLELLLKTLRTENDLLGKEEKELKDELRKVWGHKFGRLVLEHYLGARDFRSRLEM